ncbi:hypothetical protein KP509_12G018100 [Ceratopteris richardii]|uniref:CCAAT-binding factor domain-containing protein n=1 Tax=Ceratopteris richardii TaxID=49495 RepID=A0A8T2TMG4_CERRI|nr:hypothetical protein KP509_12G018100 [Ceratopteris richardii]
MPVREGDDLSSIQADVASFVTNLGLSAAVNDGNGFYDGDFRKKGRVSNSGLTRKQSDSKDKTQKSSGITSAEKKSKGTTERPNEYVSTKKKAEFNERSGSISRSREEGGEWHEKKRKQSDDTKRKRKHTQQKTRVGSFQTSKLVDKQERPAIFSKGKRKELSDNFENSTFAKKQKYDQACVLSGNNGNKTDSIDSSKGQSKFLSKALHLLNSGPWHEVLSSLINKENKNIALEVQGDKRNDQEDLSALVVNMRKKGEHLMERFVMEYESSRGKDSDMRWLMMARKTGTTADKVAALTVLLQDNAVANLRSLDSLLGMVTSKGGKRHAAMGIDALKELLLSSLLPDRKLKSLTQQPLKAQSDSQEVDVLLLLWYWEDCLKQRYGQFIASLEEASKDNLLFLKEKAVKTIYELLKNKPEQERKLLSALVNKLGDPGRAIASKAGYYLSCLLTAHPNMKMVVVQEVDFFLFRRHVGLRSIYQAVVFLNQIILSKRGDGPKLARRLIDIYFSVFKAVTKSGNTSFHEDKVNKQEKKRVLRKESEEVDTVEMDSRLLSALLTGVNRAFPYVADEDADTVVEEHTPILFRMVHSNSFNVGVQALMLLHQLLERHNAVSNRFYRTLYAVLLSPGLSKSSKMEMFLGLVFKAVKSDLNLKRIAAIVKRLMQVALQAAPHFACGCLLLVSELLKLRPMLWHAVTQPENADDEIEHFEDCKEDTETGDLSHANQALGTSELVEVTRADAELGQWPSKGKYDPRLRDPCFCNADQACWWELTALASHAHPSVAVMAKTLISGESILYAGDPLRDLALTVFLDRFAEKKPKPLRKNAIWHGSSFLTPAKKASTLVSFPIGNDFLNLSEKDVAPEDVVFHKFYVSKAERKQKSTKVGTRKDENVLLAVDDDFFGDDSDNDEIEDLLEQDEGSEMGSDELYEESDESEGQWMYHQNDGTPNVANGEVNSSDQEGGVSDLISSDDMLEEDLNEHSIENGPDVNGLSFHEKKDEFESPQLHSSKDAKKHVLKCSKGKKKKKFNGSKAQKEEQPGKSPFADIDDYKHLLNDDETQSHHPTASKGRGHKGKRI